MQMATSSNHCAGSFTALEVARLLNSESDVDSDIDSDTGGMSNDKEFELTNICEETTMTVQ